MKESSELPELVEQFTSKTVSVRVSAYRNLLQKCTSDGSSFKLDWSDYSSEDDTKKTIANLKADLCNESDDISYEAAGGCGCLLANPSFLLMLEKADQVDILDQLITVIKERKGKKLLVRTLWCIARSKLTTDVYKERSAVLLEAVCNVLKSETTSSASALEALQVIFTLVEVIPEEVVTDVKAWFPVVLKYMLHEAPRVRSIVFMILHNLKLFLAADGDKSGVKSCIVACLVADLQTKTCKKMIEIVSKDNVDILRGWRLIVHILGPVLHKGTSLINDLLEVVEKGFKSSTPDIRIEAFKCWKSLIDNFALDPDVLLHHKRLKLLLAPLKANNAKIEGLAHEKLLVWWHLIVKLNMHAYIHFDLVVVPFLKFCFSGSSPSPGCQSAGIAQRSLMMSSASSPGRRFPGLYALCAEVVAQILSVGIDIPERQHFNFVLPQLEEPIITDALFSRSYQLFIVSAIEALNSLGEDVDSKKRSRQHSLGILIVQSMVARLKWSMKSEIEKKESIDQVKELFLKFAELEQHSKAGSLVSEFVFAFYDLILTSQWFALPSSVINSRQYNISTGTTMRDMMSGTLSNHIIQQLCKRSMLHIALTKEEYFTVFITVLENSKPSTGKLGFLQSVLKELESVEGFFTPDQSGVLRRIWAILVRQLLFHIEETQIIDQGDGLEHDWSCVYNMLMFPINQSVVAFKDANESFNQQIMTDWSELFMKFIELTPLAATAEPNSEMEYIARGTLNVYKKTIASSSGVSYGAAYNLMANVLLLISQKMRYSELGKVSMKQVNSPAKPKKKLPLHNLSGSVELFEALFVGLMRMGAFPARISTAQLLCDGIITIFRGIHQEKLINPLITNVVGPITEGFKVSPFIRFSTDVGKSFVKVLRSFSLMFEQHIGAAHTADHISRLEVLLRLTLTSTNKEVKQAGRQLWKSSFAATNHPIPSSLREVLKDNSLPPVSLNDSQDDLDEYQADPKENVPDNVMPGSFMKRMGGVDIVKFDSPKSKFDSPKSKFDSPKSKFESPKVNKLSLISTPKSKEKKKVDLNDMRDEDFVKVVSPKPMSRRVLTEHQIEKLKERKDIPALYSDLSQTASQIIPAQFASQHSFEESTGGEAPEKEKAKSVESGKTSGKQLNFSGIFPSEEEEVEKTPSSTLARRRSVRASVVKGQQSNDADPVPSKSAKSKSSKTKETDVDKGKEAVADDANIDVESDITVDKKKTIAKDASLERKGNASPMKESSSNVKLSKKKQGLSEAVSLRGKGSTETVENEMKVAEAKKDDCPKEIADAVNSPRPQPASRGRGRGRRVSTPRPIANKTRRTRNGGPDVVDEAEVIGNEEKSELSIKEFSHAKAKKSKTVIEHSEVLIQEPKENEPKNDENKDLLSVSLETPGVKEVTPLPDRPVTDKQVTLDEGTVASKPINDMTNTEEPPKDDDNINAKKKIELKTYSKKKKSDDADSCLDKYSSSDSDYTYVDLDKELQKTSMVLQDSLKDCVVERIDDSPHISLESGRRKGLTPTKKTISDVRKVLKGKSTLKKSPSDSNLQKKKVSMKKSQSDMSTPKIKEKVLFKEVKGSPSVIQDKNNVSSVPEVSLGDNNGDLSGNESDEAVPSSQESDVRLAEMAEILANSRLKPDNSLQLDQTKAESDDSTNGKATVKSSSKRKRSLNDDVEEDVKQKMKRKKDDDAVVALSDGEQPSESISLTNSQSKEKEKSKKLHRLRKSLSGGDNQNSCDLFENTPPLTTPPKITRSGRKIVAPKKDMPQPMTPPGKQSAKKKDVESGPPPGNSPAKNEKLSDDPKEDTSPSLLSSHQFLRETSEVNEVSFEDELSSLGKDNSPEVVDSEDDELPDLTAEPVVKKNVQKKITDMFVKGKKPKVSEKTLPEMENVEEEILAKEQEIIDSRSPKGTEKSSTDSDNLSESLFEGKVSKELPDKLPESVKSTSLREEPRTSPVKNVLQISTDQEDSAKDKSVESPKKSSPRSPLKKRFKLIEDSVEVVKESTSSDSTNCSSSTSVEIVTCVPESMEVHDISSSVEKESPKSEKVLSPKKKWARSVNDQELSSLDDARRTLIPEADQVKEVKCDSTSKELVEQQQYSTENEADLDLAQEESNDVCDDDLPLLNSDKDASKTDVEGPVESDDDDSDLEIDVEMIDPEECVDKTKTTLSDSKEQEKPDIIDISNSDSPTNKEAPEPVKETMSKESENTVVNNKESDNVIVLSSDSKSEGSDETLKSSSKSSDSSSLENAQRVDDELREIEKKSSRSPKKDMLEKPLGSSSSSSIISAEDKLSEDELSPEKSSGSKFTNTIGTPERKKKFGSVKYAGSRAAMLVACAKQNIKNRNTEGDSPSKSSLADGISPIHKNSITDGISPVYKSSSNNSSPCGTPPTPTSRKRKAESENGKPWAKHEPSPGATPSPSILKKSNLEDTIGKDSTTSPPFKQRRVSFADPPVSDRVEIPPSPKSPKALRGIRAQKRLDMTKADSPVKVPSTPSTEQDSQPDPDSSVNVNCSQPLYPSLVDCSDRVDCVASQLTSPFLFEGLKMVLDERGIRTVGDLCRLTEADIRQLPVREPKVVGILSVLKKYEETKDSGKKQIDAVIMDVEAQLSEIFGQDGEIILDTEPPSTSKVDVADVPVTTLHSSHESTRSDLPVEDGIAPLEPSTEAVNCEVLNAFCKQVSDKPQLLDVLVEKVTEESRQKLLKAILVEMPYGAVLETFFAYLRKRDTPSSK